MTLNDTILKLEHPIEGISYDAGLDIEHVVIARRWHQGSIDIAQFNRKLVLLDSRFEDTLLVYTNHKVKVRPQWDVNNSKALDLSLLSIAKLVRETYLISMLYNYCSRLASFLRLLDHSLQVCCSQVPYPNLKRACGTCCLISDEVGESTFELKQV